MGFVHSPLLNGQTGVYRGLIHVSDWFPTILALAGATVSGVVRHGRLARSAPRTGQGQGLDLDLGLDGHDVWPAITTNTTSPRTELLHNIDPVSDTAISKGFVDAARQSHNINQKWCSI